MTASHAARLVPKPANAAHAKRAESRTAADAVAQAYATLLERESRLREQEAALAGGITAREVAGRMELFMALASHELRTPLSIIKAYQQLTEQHLTTCLPEAEGGACLAGELRAARESLADAQQASLRLGALLDDLMQASSAKAGKLLMHPRPCDVMDIVSEVLRHLRQTHPARRVRLVAPATRRVPTIADPERIAQVVRNYLANAFKYAPADQPVEMRMRFRGGVVRVSVRDRGPGVRPADRRAIWDGFYQVPGVPPQPGSEAGLGVGLYVCRMIVEQHGGQVGVDSSLGKGSTFWFTLPLFVDVP